MSDDTKRPDEPAALLRPQFLVLALPRSRTAWMAHFLNRNPFGPVGHDIGIECNTVEQFLDSYINGMVGTVETGTMIGWRLLPLGMKIVTVRRPVAEVRAALGAFGLAPEGDELEARDALLDVIESQPNVRSIAFSDLRSPYICRWLYEHCLGIAWDGAWWQALRDMNIQVDMPARIAQLAARASALSALKLDVLSRTQALPPCPVLH